MTGTLRPGMLLQTLLTIGLTCSTRHETSPERASRLAMIARTNHKLDVAFPVKANGLIQIQPSQWDQLAVPAPGYTHPRAGLAPVIPRNIAGTVFKTPPGKLRDGHLFAE